MFTTNYPKDITVNNWWENPPPEEKFIVDLFQWGQKERVKKIRAEYEMDGEGQCLAKEAIIENMLSWQCWFCHGQFQKGSSKCSNKLCENYLKNDNDNSHREREREREREKKTATIPTNSSVVGVDSVVKMII